MASFTVLGIETSCDETAAAVVRLEGGAAQILAERVESQASDHAPFGGVVPEIAARAHVAVADTCIARVMAQANLDYAQLDAVAATSGPGLIGGVLVGMMTGKALAQASGVQFLPINHLEGHALSPRLAGTVAFPYLLLLVSGGHCQFLDVRGVGAYERLGTTLDDAAGEAFDKTAKVLGLGFPGGPEVERMALCGDPGAVDLPRPLLAKPGLDMSFAGLKTAVARAAAAGADPGDLCASFQRAMCDVLVEKARRALRATGRSTLVVSGGVAANKAVRSALGALASEVGAEFIAPPLAHCTDNGAMIALAGCERLSAGLTEGSDLAFKARPRWPLDAERAEASPAYGYGKRGPKA
ncbi:MAG: tRNA (adenosine(37)-N6)-threonylcarbamoyltransferase complex transferase subunit TsaD [Pseudomonadota bacterium]